MWVRGGGENSVFIKKLEKMSEQICSVLVKDIKKTEKVLRNAADGYNS